MATNQSHCPNCLTPFNSSEWKRDERNGLYICPSCNMPHDMAALGLDENDPRRVQEEEINRIYRMLENLNFRAADSELRGLRDKYPKNAKVYFLSALSNNCISYVNSDNDKNWPYPKIPTLNNIHFENIMETEFVRKALDFSSGDERKCYEDTLNYIEKVRQKIELAYRQGEYQFDVFISVKIQKVDEETREVVLDDDGEPKRTTDYKLASDLYDFIKEKFPGCRVFLSERQASLFTGKEYENIIFSALHSSKVFILVANSRFNVEWHWVRNEWMRYLYLMDPETAQEEAEKDLRRSFVFVTKEMNLNDIPSEFKKRQAIQWGKTGAESNLLDFIRENLSTQKFTKIKTSSFDQGVETIDNVTVEEMQIARRAFSETGQIDSSVEEQINGVIYQLSMLDPSQKTYDSFRRSAFDDFHEILKKNPDAYRAKLYLLLEKTNYNSFDEFFKNFKNVSSNFEVAEEYLNVATEKDSINAINTIISTLLSGKNDDYKLIDQGYRKFVAPYLDLIDKDSLKKLAKKFKTIFGALELKERDDFKIADDYLEISHFLDGTDAKKYLEARQALLDRVTDVEANPSLSAWIEKITNEMIKVNPSNVSSQWTKLLNQMKIKMTNPINLATNALLDSEGGK